MALKNYVSDCDYQYEYAFMRHRIFPSGTLVPGACTVHARGLISTFEFCNSAKCNVCTAQLYQFVTLVFTMCCVTYF